LRSVHGCPITLSQTHATLQKVNEKKESLMIIHAHTVELAPHDLRLLESGGLPLANQASAGALTPIGRADLAGLLNTAVARANDPTSLAVLSSFLKQLRV
jgi:hypothetical protein